MKLPKLAQLGWLPLGQAISIASSVIVFAVLARTLGPTPFATFATALFLFTLVSLSLDLSPQGYLLVHGDSAANRAASWRSATISGVAASVAVLGVVEVGTKLLLGEAFSLLGACLLGLAALIQMLIQVPRAILLASRAYFPAALADALAAILGGLAAIAISLFWKSPEVLALQLLAVVIVRAATIACLAPSSFSRPRTSAVPQKEAIAYGLKVMPINVASYASRAIDSGLLPAIIPSTAAAAYSRSYQLVVVPLTQLQLSLGPAIVERLARAPEDGRRDAGRARVWRVVSSVGGVSAVLIGLLAWPIASVMFGPAWPMSGVFISAMSCVLPSVAATYYISWQLQLHASARRSTAHLTAVVVAPMLVVLAALASGTQAAVATLALGGLVTPAVLLMSHRSLLVGVAKRRIMLTVGTYWLICFAVFLTTAHLSGFWTFDEWINP